MDKLTLKEKVSKGDYTKQQLLGWIQALPGSTGSHKPNSIKVGDVYMHPIFKHPYVFLENKGEYWICGLLTTDGDFEKLNELEMQIKNCFYFACPSDKDELNHLMNTQPKRTYFSL